MIGRAENLRGWWWAVLSCNWSRRKGDGVGRDGRGSVVGVFYCDWSRQKLGGVSPSVWLSTQVSRKFDVLRRSFAEIWCRVARCRRNLMCCGEVSQKFTTFFRSNFAYNFAVAVMRILCI